MQILNITKILNGARKLTKWGIIGAVAFSSMVSCDILGPKKKKPDPKPGAVNVEVDAPASLYQDEEGTWGASCEAEDGIAEVQFFYDTPSGNVEERITPNSTRWDTSFTDSHADMGTVNLQVICEGDFAEGDNPRDQSLKQTTITEHPYATTTLKMHDFFDGGAVDGHVTFPGHRTIPIVNGEGPITRADKIDVDSLRNGQYRVLVEPEEGYVNQSRRVRMNGNDIESFDIVPEVSGEWTWEKQKNLMWPQYQSQDTLSRRWKKGSEITVYGFNESYFEPCEELPGLCSRKSTDQNLIPSEDFINFSIAAYERLDEIIDEVDLTIRLESEGDEGFPRSTLDTYQEIPQIIFGGWPKGTYAITQGKIVDEDGSYEWADMQQYTNPPVQLGDRYGPFSDAAESLGANTNDGRGLTFIDRSPEYSKGYTEVAEKYFDYVYSRPTFSGRVQLEDGLANMKGDRTYVVEDYISDNQE